MPAAADVTGDEALVVELEAHARGEIARRGAWSSAVSRPIAASRLAAIPADRERLALEAIEAMLYSGDGAAARRLAEQKLTRAWERRAPADDDQLSATIAQRSAFLCTSRLRGRDAIEWVERAVALAPGDPATGLLAAPSLALGMSFTGAREQAHAALDRWLDDPSGSPRAAGFALFALNGLLLMGDGDLPAASQHIGRTEPLRTGTYATTLTFTSSTTTP